MRNVLPLQVSTGASQESCVFSYSGRRQPECTRIIAGKYLTVASILVTLGVGHS